MRTCQSHTNTYALTAYHCALSPPPQFPWWRSFRKFLSGVPFGGMVERWRGGAWTGEWRTHIPSSGLGEGLWWQTLDPGGRGADEGEDASWSRGPLNVKQRARRQWPRSWPPVYTVWNPGIPGRNSEWGSKTCISVSALRLFNFSESSFICIYKMGYNIKYYFVFYTNNSNSTQQEIGVCIRETVGLPLQELHRSIRNDSESLTVTLREGGIRSLRDTKCQHGTLW